MGAAFALAAGCSGGASTTTTTTGVLVQLDPMGSATGLSIEELAEPRTEVVGAAWQGGVAVAGGLGTDGGGSRRLDVWHVEPGTWSAGPDLPIPLHHAGMAALGDRIYVVGGYSNDAGGEWLSQDRVFSLGPGEDAWREEARMGRPRGALAVTSVGDRLVAVGGVAEGVLTARVESWSPGESEWRREPDLGTAREHLGAASAQGRVYAIAGRLGGIDTNLDTVESWAPGERSWRAEPSLRQARGGIGAATVAPRVCVAGGEEPAGTIAALECRDPDSGQWTVVGQLAEPRHGVAVVERDGALHVVGGGSRPGLFVSGVHEVFLFG